MSRNKNYKHKIINKIGITVQKQTDSVRNAGRMFASGVAFLNESILREPNNEENHGLSEFGSEQLPIGKEDGSHFRSENKKRKADYKQKGNPTVQNAADYISPNKQAGESDEEALRELLRQKSTHERDIAALIGGKTGIQATWERLVACAVNEDELGFLSYATSFPGRVELLKEHMDMLTAVTNNRKYLGSSQKSMVQMLKRPFEYAETYQRLLSCCDALCISRLLDSDRIDLEELHRFGLRMKEDLDR